MNLKTYLLHLAICFTGDLFMVVELTEIGMLIMFVSAILAIGELHDTAKENNVMLKQIHEKLGIKEEEKK